MLGRLIQDTHWSMTQMQVHTNKQMQLRNLDSNKTICMH